MLRVYLVRHGETDWNVQGRLQGSQDTPLNPKGLEQAHGIALRLAREGGFAALYSSPLSRAWRTAQIIAGMTALNPIPDARLQERALGQAEGLTGPELGERFPRCMWPSPDGRARTPFPGEEGREIFAERASSFLRDLRALHPDGKVIVVSHGGAIGIILALVIRLDLERLLPFWLDNGSISVVELGDAVDRVLKLNDSCHLAARDGGSEFEQAIAGLVASAPPASLQSVVS